MKSLFSSLLLIATTLFTFSASAVNNQQIRECRIRGGEFVAINTGSDQIGLCHLGSAYIGAIDLMLVVNHDGSPQSVEMYASEMKKCSPLGAARTFPNLEGQEIALCTFNDGSIIGLATLNSGRYSAQNSLLNQALGL
jgi:hypothetical protein